MATDIFGNARMIDQQTLSRISLLIVEDDEDQAFLEKDKLESTFAHSTVEVVHTAEECMKRPFQKYDLVLLDLNLPDIFGLELLNQIQKKCDVPVVIITGESDVSLAVSALKSGAYDYVIKSSNAIEMLPIVVENAIKNHLTKKESQTLKERLIQSEKLASIGKLASGVAHEINNPLTAILGFAEILLMQSGNGQRNKLQKIHESALRCKKIVEDLLSFAREHKSERKLLEVNEILDRSLSIGNNLIKMHNIEVEKHLQNPSPCMIGDEFHMQQVFVNIISNACHAMERSERKLLAISTQSDHNSVLITLTDTGHGIPEEHICKIFDPFFTTKEVGKGSGLGLSICYGIIKDHFGSIRAESPAGAGATFVIELPKADPSTLTYETADPTRREECPLQNTSMLILEDEESICDFYREALQGENNIMHFAHSGKEAFQKLDLCDFDLIILDLRMPEVDGIQFYKFLKSKKPHLLSRVLICTGDTISPDVREFFSSINNIVLHKPFSLADFKKSVTAIVGMQEPVSL